VARVRGVRGVRRGRWMYFGWGSHQGVLLEKRVRLGVVHVITTPQGSMHVALKRS